MKKLFLTLVGILFVASVFAEGIDVICSQNWKDHEYLDYPYFDLCYIDDFESAEYVTWIMTKDMAEAPNLPRKDNFRADPNVTKGSALPQDYASTGFDRGHLAPNNDFNYSAESMDATFLMSNMSPQTPTLNRQTWRCTESLDAEYAKKYEKVYICCGPIFNDNKATIFIGRYNKVGVPDAYFRIFYNPSGLLKCYIVPQSCRAVSPANNDTVEKLERKLKDFESDISEIESKTGLKFIFE